MKKTEISQAEFDDAKAAAKGIRHAQGNASDEILAIRNAKSGECFLFEYEDQDAFRLAKGRISMYLYHHHGAFTYSAIKSKLSIYIKKI